MNDLTEQLRDQLDRYVDAATSASPSRGPGSPLRPSPRRNDLVVKVAAAVLIGTTVAVVAFTSARRSVDSKLIGSTTSVGTVAPATTPTTATPGTTAALPDPPTTPAISSTTAPADYPSFPIPGSQGSANATDAEAAFSFAQKRLGIADAGSLAPVGSGRFRTGGTNPVTLSTTHGAGSYAVTAVEGSQHMQTIETDQFTIASLRSGWTTSVVLVWVDGMGGAPHTARDTTAVGSDLVVRRRFPACAFWSYLAVFFDADGQLVDARSFTTGSKPAPATPGGGECVPGSGSAGEPERALSSERFDTSEAAASAFVQRWFGLSAAVWRHVYDPGPGVAGGPIYELDIPGRVQLTVARDDALASGGWYVDRLAGDASFSFGPDPTLMQLVFVVNPGWDEPRVVVHTFGSGVPDRGIDPTVSQDVAESADPGSYVDAAQITFSNPYDPCTPWGYIAVIRNTTGQLITAAAYTSPTEPCDADGTPIGLNTPPWFFGPPTSATTSETSDPPTSAPLITR